MNEYNVTSPPVEAAMVLLRDAARRLGVSTKLGERVEQVWRCLVSLALTSHCHRSSGQGLSLKSRFSLVGGTPRKWTGPKELQGVYAVPGEPPEPIEAMY